MPIAPIEAPASVREQALYLPGRRIYSQTQGNKPGLQEEISLLPLSIIEILRSFVKPGIASAAPLHLGGGVSFQENTISTKAEWIIKGDAVYYIEPLSFTVSDAAHWGFFEIKLTDEEGKPTGLDFWDSGIDRAALKEANTKTLNKVLIQENYSALAEFPQVSAGYTKWISYEKDTAGNLGNLQSAEHLPAQNFSIHSLGSPIGGFTKMEILTSSGTWGRDKSIQNIFVFAMGGGGGSSSTSRKDNANTPGAIAGAGGGAGFYSFSFFSIASASGIDVTIGAGGAGGTRRTASNGVNSGSTGGQTTVSIDGSLVLTAKGGMGGDSEGTASWFNNFVRNAIGGRGSSNGGDGQAKIALSSQVGGLDGGLGGTGITLDGSSYGGGGDGPSQSGPQSLVGNNGQNGVVLILY